MKNVIMYTLTVSIKDHDFICKTAKDREEIIQLYMKYTFIKERYRKSKLNCITITLDKYVEKSRSIINERTKRVYKSYKTMIEEDLDFSQC